MELIGNYKGNNVYSCSFDEYYNAYRNGDIENGAIHCLNDCDNYCVQDSNVFARLVGRNIVTVSPVSARVMFKEKFDALASQSRREEHFTPVEATERRTVESLADEGVDMLDALVEEGRKKLEEQTEVAETRQRKSRSKRNLFNEGE